MPSAAHSLPPLRLPAAFGLALFFAAVAVGLGALFHAYPPVPWNGDDWAYFSKWAWFYPSVDKWNPARIFQETFMPFCGYFAAYVVSPLFSLEYVRSLMIVTALASSAAVLLMTVAAYRLFAYALADRLSGCALAGTFLCCFWVGHKYFMPPGFPHEGPNLQFSCYMPNMLNLTMLLALCRMQLAAWRGVGSLPGQRLRMETLSRHGVFFAVFLVCAYLTQFSMTTSSIIPASYAGGLLLFEGIAFWRKEKNVAAGMRRWLRRFTCLHAMCLTLVVFWFAAALFDLGGDRYAYFSSRASSSFLTALWLNLKTLKHFLSPRLMNLLAGLALAAAALLVRRKMTRAFGSLDAAFLRFCVLVLTACAACFVLNVLATMPTGEDFARRAAFGVLSYIFFILCALAAYIALALPWTRLLLPLIALHVCSLMWLSPVWKERPRAQYDFRTGIVRQWLEDARRADAEGRDEVIVYTPTEYWPHDKKTMGRILSDTFLRHAVVSRPLTVDISSVQPGAAQGGAEEQPSARE